MNTMEYAMSSARSVELPYKLRVISGTEMEVELFPIPSAYAGMVFAGVNVPAYKIPVPFTATSGNVKLTISSNGTSISNGTYMIAKDTNVKATGIELDKNSAEISIREELQLKAKVLPENASDKTVLWKSSNEDVAYVAQNGLVVGKGAGTADITATTKNGEFLAKCTVTVNNTLAKLKLGDVDGVDGVTAQDAALALRDVLTKDDEGFAEGGLEATNVTGGDKITALDAAAILRKALDPRYEFKID